MRAALLLLAAACGGPGSPKGSSDPGDAADGSSTPGGTTDGSAADGGPTDGGSTDGGSADGGHTDSDGVDSAAPWPWAEDACAHLGGASTGWTGTAARWVELAARAPALEGDLIAVGSSTIRRWEGLRALLGPWGLHQRGFGGAHMRDLALLGDTLSDLPGARGLVVFAGTNDIAGGAPPEQVAADARCFFQRVYLRHGGIPIWYLTITPTPARWAVWDQARAADAQIAAFAEDLPWLRIVDSSAAFLATGSPPAAHLFDPDGLHLSADGYAILSAALLDALGPPPAPAPAAGWAPGGGATLLIDLGPGDGVDGVALREADGQTWNAWDPIAGGAELLPGERTGGLRSADGAATPVDLVVSGGLFANGLRSGGLVDPDPSLGALARPEATGDFVFTDGADHPGAFTITGLDPAARYRVSLVASRGTAEERRVTRFTLQGASTSTATVDTSGPHLPAPFFGNTGTLVTFDGIMPDDRGELQLDLTAEAGAFAYLNALSIESL